MSRWIHRTAALALAAAAAGCAPDAPLAPTEGAPAGVRSDNAPVHLVTFKDGVDVPSTTQELAREFGFGVRFVRRHAAPGFSAVIPRPLADRLRQDPRVLIVEEDGPVSLIFPIDGMPRDKARPGGGGGGGQQTPWGIAKVGGAGDGTGKTAWIIDTGIDLDHPDLNTSKVCHRNFSSGNSADDGNGHGTHVAGTIAAIDNSTGVVGVAANAYVCAVRVLNNAGSGSWESVINGVNYVAANGASGDVANMSLGGSGSNATLEKAISDASAKVKFAIAAGNDGSNAANYTPARVNGTNIYTVSAVNSTGCMASWSNYGNPPVDYAAPGVSILSTYKGGGTRTLSGTSMAAPHVAGILLLTSVKTNGFASCDPDGSPDPIAHR